MGGYIYLDLRHFTDLIVHVENRVVQNFTIIYIVLRFIFVVLLSIIRVPSAILVVDVDFGNYSSASTQMPIVAKDGHVDFLQIKWDGWSKLDLFSEMLHLTRKIQVKLEFLLPIVQLTSKDLISRIQLLMLPDLASVDAV